MLFLRILVPSIRHILQGVGPRASVMDGCIRNYFTLQMRPLVTAFARGMADIVDPQWLGLFNAKEFNQVR